MADILDFKQPPAPASPPQEKPAAEISAEDFRTICAGLETLPRNVRIAAIMRACTDDDLEIICAVIASELGPAVLEHVQFGLQEFPVKGFRE